MKKFFIPFFVVATILINCNSVFASSDYVLPYPSAMPGGFMYKTHLILENVLKYWYFGNFGQFTYNLKESDKYLVEAKTLFEYNQYLLGYKALQKSDGYFQKTLPFLVLANKEGKDIKSDRVILSSAALKHTEVLQKLKKELPESFNWQPEKSVSSFLNLRSLIENSILTREKYQ